MDSSFNEVIDPGDLDMSDFFCMPGAGDSDFSGQNEGEEFDQLQDIMLKPEPMDPSATKGPAIPDNKEEDEIERKKRIRRAQIAASGRRGRAKRKREKMDLEAKNKKLEEENKTLQATIAELQFEMQRAHSAKQLSIFQMENEILKKQVLEHRKFVGQVQRLMKGPDTTKIERKRLIQQGSNSALGQLLGLLYSSASETSWKDIQNVQTKTELFEFKAGKFQYLPYNSTAATAKRFGIRADFLCKCKAKYLAKVQWDSIFDTGKDFDSFFASSLVSEGKVNDIKNVQLRLSEVKVDADTTTASQEDEKHSDSNRKYNEVKDIFSESQTTKIRKHIQVKQVKEGDETISERLSVVTIRTGLKVQVPFYEQQNQEVKEEEVIVVTTIASDTLQELTAKDENVIRDGSTRITGYIFRNRPNGTCLVSVIWSKPISKDGWVGFRPQDEVQIYDDGQVNPRLVDICKIFLNAATEQANKLEEQFAKERKDSEGKEYA